MIHGKVLNGEKLRLNFRMCVHPSVGASVRASPLGWPSDPSADPETLQTSLCTAVTGFDATKLALRSLWLAFRSLQLAFRPLLLAIKPPRLVPSS